MCVDNVLIPMHIKQFLTIDINVLTRSSIWNKTLGVGKLISWLQQACHGMQHTQQPATKHIKRAEHPAASCTLRSTLRLISDKLNKPHYCCVWWCGGCCSQRPLACHWNSLHAVSTKKDCKLSEVPYVWSLKRNVPDRAQVTNKLFFKTVQNQLSQAAHIVVIGCDLKRHVRSGFLKFHASMGQERRRDK